MRFARAKFLLGIIALFPVAGCSSQAPSLPDCPGTISPAASAGATPRFTWTPSCQLEGLTVTATGTGTVVWSVASSSQTNSIGPGVMYGHTPSGAQVMVPATALATGVSYTVSFSRFDDGHGGSIQSAGALSFVP